MPSEAYDYSVLDRAVADRALAAAGRIRKQINEAHDSYILAGRELLAVRDTLSWSTSTGDMHGVDEAECRTAARLIHWPSHSQEHRAIQVDVAVDLAKKKVARIAQRVRDNGTVRDQRPMAEVAMALDILHNRRGGGQAFPLIAAALKDSDPMSALSQIGRTSVFADRIDRVRKRAKPVLGSRSFKNLRNDESTNSFA